MEEEGSAATRVYLQKRKIWMTNDNCLSGSLGNKRGIGVLSQLELLTDVKGLYHSMDTMILISCYQCGTTLSEKKKNLPTWNFVRIHIA